jgi:hypothetical protein
MALTRSTYVIAAASNLATSTSNSFKLDGILRQSISHKRPSLSTA